MGMGLQFHHRKLIDYSINKTATDDICSSACNLTDNSTFCKHPCLFFCPNYCHDLLESLVPPQSPVVITYDYHPNKSRKFLFITASVLSTILLVLLFYVIFVKFYLGWWAGSRRRSSSPSEPRIENGIHDFLDHEDHGPVADHHIWYINTVGLQPSIINGIAVFKYKRGDGLIEGTVCSVCLSEFQDDENLRLLPKCSHGFHVSCIDTWLRSHTNCPMCRAPIVNNAASASSSESNNENSSPTENTRVSVLVNNGEIERELEDGVVEQELIQLGHTRKRSENPDDIQPIRRSVSLDCVSASKILQGHANFVPEEIVGNSDVQLAADVKIVPKTVGRTESLGKFVGCSSIRRSLQNTQFSLKRSFSCRGKFLFSRPT